MTVRKYLPMPRHIGKTRLDEFDWYDMFSRFRERGHDPRVVRVSRILELLKTPLNPLTHTELNGPELLGRYKWHSVVQPSRQGRIEVLRPPQGADEWEYTAVRWLLNLLRESGELDRVHKCKMWGKRDDCLGWFYARPYGNRDRFCSDACKQFEYDSEPEIKARRRAQNAKHNQDYRKNQKIEDERRKRGVGFGRAISRRAKRS